MMKNKTMRCAVSPYIGREMGISTPSPPGAEKLLIVGGGPAGMQAAITACERGHQVTLVEQVTGWGASSTPTMRTSRPISAGTGT